VLSEVLLVFVSVVVETFCCRVGLIITVFGSKLGRRCRLVMVMVLVLVLLLSI